MKPLPTPLNMYAHNVIKKEVKATGRKGQTNGDLLCIKREWRLVDD